MDKPVFRKPPLLLVAGAKGAVGSTVAAAVAGFKKNAESLQPCLTTGACFEGLGSPGEMEFAGWDVTPRSLREAFEYHRVLPPETLRPLEELLEAFQVRRAPSEELSFPAQVERLCRDIQDFKKMYPGTRPVLINLLPACESLNPGECSRMDELYSRANPAAFPDLVYGTAAILSGVPVVNFTPNVIEIPFLVSEAAKAGVPLCGRDGKTGQTYLKVVLASALKARSLRVDGWYSLNILGNEDGRNLADPKRAAGKLANKTEILEEVLGYPVGGQNGAPAHKVVIDYYPPRGDSKEAWDVIDFSGLFGLPMSLRLNLLARDSVLAAPLVIDLARWMVCLQSAGRSGLVPELAFYFKKPLGVDPPITFQDQLAKLDELAAFCSAER
jgi:myo-inositol-1-phosphate synthase